MWGFLSTVCALFFAVSRFHHVVATTASASFLPQGFVFDWNPPGTTVPIPITQQCETLHISWERGSTSVGQNPTAPYFLQIFTSIFKFHLAPEPSIKYACTDRSLRLQWDSLGVSGGCQDIYTVIPNSSATAQNPATCTNVTFAHPPLQVDAAVVNGAFSQYGWVPQCTDIQVQAKNGTGPYTLTVAPTLHPPLNITSNGGGPINWTVSLSHGFPFFISVTDSQGNSWSQGPLHSGDNGDTACLNLNHSPDGHSSSIVPATIGASVGGILVGLLAGAFGILAFGRWRGSRRHDKPWENQIRDSMLSSDSPRNPREMTSTSGGGREHIVEPFGVPSTLRSSSPGNPGVPLPPGGNITNPTTSPGSSDPADQSGRRPNVYVVHHDGGRAPVTVYTEEGAEVVELPPQYAAGSTSTPLESDASREVDRRGEPDATPRKTREPRKNVVNG
ncbi:hypothetical protein F5888DRAFT_1633638 [Russula emetica]|nr:hypothetical protein F5888DRAFT_1633638 [Russula emetica]